MNMLGPIKPAQNKTNDEINRQIILATQTGLPLVNRPYDAIGAQLSISGTEVKSRLQAMLDSGVIRRIGVVPNHYRLGYTANGMSVWDVSDDVVDQMGALVGALDFVSHCYCRPRHLPVWPYNLFAMVHGKNKQQVEKQVATIAGVLGDHSRCHDIVYSTKILKKTGLRLSPPKEVE